MALDRMNVTNLSKLGYWLNRESSVPECTGWKANYTTSERKNLIDKMKKCRTIEEYVKLFQRTRSLEAEGYTAQPCTEEALADTRAFIEQFGQSRGRVGGARNFCAAASEYLKRPGWGFEECSQRLSRGGKQADYPHILQTFTEGEGKADICPYIENAIARASSLQQQLERIEGGEAKRHPRSRWLGSRSRKEQKYAHYPSYPSLPSTPTTPTSYAPSPSASPSATPSLTPTSYVTPPSPLPTPSTPSGGSMDKARELVELTRSLDPQTLQLFISLLQQQATTK